MTTQQELFDSLEDAVIRGDIDGAVQLAQQVIDDQVDPVAAIEQGLRPGITYVGDGFANQELFLPDLVIAADAMKAATDLLNEEIQRQGMEKVGFGKVVLGTVAGDLHDIGKTIAGTMLAASGFDVLDLGVDVPVEKFVQKVRDEEAVLLGMSSLLTTTAKELSNVIEALEDVGIRDSVKVIVGGGAVTEEYSQSIGTDGYGHDAELGVRTAKQLLGIS